MNTMRFTAVAAMALTVLVAGCEVDPEEADVVAETWLEDEADAARLGGGFPGGSGDRCTTFDGVTSGCEDDEICLPIACTNAIPPFCFGFCQQGFTFP